MKNAYLILLCACFYGSLAAQNTNVRLTEESVVKDSAGNVYPYMIWKNFMMQPDYEIRPINQQNRRTDFLLVRLTEQQKNERLEKMPKPKESDYFVTGRNFKDFKAVDINNNKINLKEEKGKILVVNFWFVNCPPCRMEIPSLNELVDTFKYNENVKFIAIALDDKYELQKFLKVFAFDYSIVHNGGGVALKYGIRSYPTHVIVDQEGKIYFHTTGLGMNTVYWLKKSIDELAHRPLVSQQ